MAKETKLQASAKDIHKRVVKILSEQLGVREELVTLASTMDDLGGDSLDAVEIVMAFEEEWETEITDCEMEKVETPRDVITLLLPKVNARCTFDAAHEAAAELKELKGSKPAAKKAPAKRAIVSAPPAEKKAGLIHADDVAEYTINSNVGEEFTELFNNIFRNPQAAFLSRYESEKGDTWRIQLRTRLNFDGHDTIVGLLENAGFRMVKVTEHMVQMYAGTNSYGIVSAVHFALSNLD